jgi:hypothetical protein
MRLFQARKQDVLSLLFKSAFSVISFFFGSHKALFYCISAQKTRLPKTPKNTTCSHNKFLTVKENSLSCAAHQRITGTAYSSHISYNMLVRLCISALFLGLFQGMLIFTSLHFNRITSFSPSTSSFFIQISYGYSHFIIH